MADGHAWGRSYVEAVGRSLTSVKFSFALLAFFHLGERRKVTSGRPQTISLVRQSREGIGEGLAAADLHVSPIVGSPFVECSL